MSVIFMNPSLEDDNVKIVQSKLMEQGYDIGSCGVDGYFGKATLDAVKIFQNDKGLMVDGIVGIDTWEMLMER